MRGDTVAASPFPSRAVRFWPDRRTIWRWHFLAGLFCLPFVAFLSLTGSVYLFKPQIDALIDRPFDQLRPHGLPATPEAEVRAALGALPGARLLAFELPAGPRSAARVVVEDRGAAVRVYVDPYSLAVLKRVAEADRFERIVFRLHGQLLLGNVGSVVMEMVASWTIVLVVTGVMLWWPSRKQGLGGAAYPRLGVPGRTRWRDLHAVTGVWVSLFLVLFLLSGLPWSFVWGHALAQAERSVGGLFPSHPAPGAAPAAVRTPRGWEIGATPMRDVVAGRPVPASMPGMDMTPDTAAAGYAGIDAVVAAAARLSFPPPVLVTPPAMAGDPWRVRSDTQDRPLRIAARVAADGTVLDTERSAGKGGVDRVVAYAVAAHEGQLFGVANQVLNLVVATGLLLASGAASVLWLRRRPPNSLGLPAAPPDRRAGFGALAVMAGLGVLLPELGASLLVLWVLARAWDRRRSEPPGGLLGGPLGGPLGGNDGSA